MLSVLCSLFSVLIVPDASFAFQSMNYYHALKARGVPTKILHYPNDDHGVTRVVMAGGDCTVNTTRWFNKYLDHKPTA